MDTPPIIFIHYSNPDFLNYTFKFAKKNNPSKTIILLGDETNKKTAESHGVQFEMFEDYESSELIREFNSVYKFIGGSEHGKKSWTHFVFLRWYIIYEYLVFNGIEKFWTFDTDTLILKDLSTYEHELSQYECTDQCSGICLNGFVLSRDLVRRYLIHTISLFKNTAFLAAQQQEFKTKRNYAFTEMRAYKSFKEAENINSKRILNLNDLEFFDECLCDAHDFEQYRLMSYSFDRVVKKLFFDTNGKFYAKKMNGTGFKEFITINMSWTPLDLYRQIWQIHTGKISNRHFRMVSNDSKLYLLNPDFKTIRIRLANKFRKIFKSNQYN